MTNLSYTIWWWWWKVGGRGDLEPEARRLLEATLGLGLEKGGQSLLDKLRLKILQRIGLLFLRPRLASWRYQRGAR